MCRCRAETADELRKIDLVGGIRLEQEQPAPRIGFGIERLESRAGWRQLVLLPHLVGLTILGRVRITHRRLPAPPAYHRVRHPRSYGRSTRRDRNSLQSVKSHSLGVTLRGTAV